MNSIKIAFLFTSLFIITSCGENKSMEGPENTENSNAPLRVEKQQFISSAFELGAVTEREFSNKLKVAGKIQLPEKNQAVVSSLLDGVVGPVNWLEGQWVSRGTTLFTLTNPELINMQEEFLVARGELGYLKEEFARQDQLAAENITSKKDLLKAKSMLSTTQAKYNSLKKKLNLYGINTDNLGTENLVSSIAITAPISGFISDIDVLRGSYLQSTRSALKISNTNKIHLDLSVLEKDAHLLRKGQDIIFTIQNDPGKKYKAKIYLVNKMIEENHTINVHAHIDAADAKTLLPGLFASAEIILDKKSHKALPTDALIKLGQDWNVLKLIGQDDSGYDFKQIKVGVEKEENGFSAVPNLKADESQYLTKGAYFLIQ